MIPRIILECSQSVRAFHALDGEDLGFVAHRTQEKHILDINMYRKRLVNVTLRLAGDLALPMVESSLDWLPLKSGVSTVL
jgi:hypothetical protein